MNRPWHEVGYFTQSRDTVGGDEEWVSTLGHLHVRERSDRRWSRIYSCKMLTLLKLRQRQATLLVIDRLQLIGLKRAWRVVIG